MSINPLTFGSPVYSPPFSVSSGDIDVMKLRSKETSPLSHESLDENFTNLANKVNQILGLNIDELNITSAGVISASNLGISASSGLIYDQSIGVFKHQNRPSAPAGYSTGDLGNSNRRFINAIDFDSFGHVTGFQSGTLNFSGSGSVAVNQDSFNQITISSSAYTSGSSPSFGNIAGSKLTLGNGVELRESVHRSDLLEIRSLQSGWGGIQIKNNTSEHLWSLMADGTTFGLYDDISNEWSWQAQRDAGLLFYHNGVVKLQTRTSGIQVTSHVNGFPNTDISADNATALRVIGNDNAVLDMGVNGGAGTWIQARNNSSDNHPYSLLLNPNGGKIGIGTTTPEGKLEINHSGTWNNPSIHLKGQFPTIKFNDTNTSEDDWYIHVNSNNFYILCDRGASGADDPIDDNNNSWDSPHPIQLEGDTNKAYIFGHEAYHAGNLPAYPTVSSASQKIQDASGSYGSVKVTSTTNGYAGYAIQDDWVLMSNGAGLCGIYNDTNNEWGLICRQNAETELFHNGAMKLETTSSGVTVSGDLAVTGNVTHQNGLRVSPIDQWHTEYSSSSKKVYSIEAEGFMGSAGSSAYGPDSGFSSFYVNQVPGNEGTVPGEVKIGMGIDGYTKCRLGATNAGTVFLEGGTNEIMMGDGQWGLSFFTNNGSSSHSTARRRVTKILHTENVCSRAAFHGDWFATYGSSSSANYDMDLKYDHELKLSKLHPTAINDTTSGATSRAFKVQPGILKYTVTILAKANTNFSSGFYIGVAEYDGTLPEGKVAISHNASSGESYVVEDTRVHWLRNNASISSSRTQYTYTFDVAPTCKWFSIMMLNWSGMGSDGTIYFDPEISIAPALDIEYGQGNLDVGYEFGNRGANMAWDGTTFSGNSKLYYTYVKQGKHVHMDFAVTRDTTVGMRYYGSVRYDGLPFAIYNPQHVTGIYNVYNNGAFGQGYTLEGYMKALMFRIYDGNIWMEFPTNTSPTDLPAATNAIHGSIDYITTD
jgi:hypothetical protein